MKERKSNFILRILLVAVWSTIAFSSSAYTKVCLYSDTAGNTLQTSVYYPYGEPTIEPQGQRYLFGGKEREHAAGRNSYDFGARNLAPYGRWSVVDPLAEKTYPISPYAYCGGDPINRIDSDGKVFIFVNGMHTGDGGSAKYWAGVDKIIMNAADDNKAIYFDGAIGGKDNLITSLNIEQRYESGRETGYSQAESIFKNLEEGETIKIVTHSMGAAYAKGFIAGLQKYGKEKGFDATAHIKFELDIAPFQPKKQQAQPGVTTVTLQHSNDIVAGCKKMPETRQILIKKENIGGLLDILINGFKSHSIESFAEDIIKIYRIILCNY